MGAREALRSSRRSTVRSSSLLKMIPTSRMRRARSRISQDRELQFRPPVTWDKMASMDMGDLLS